MGSCRGYGAARRGQFLLKAEAVAGWGLCRYNKKLLKKIGNLYFFFVLPKKGKRCSEKLFLNVSLNRVIYSSSSALLWGDDTREAARGINGYSPLKAAELLKNPPGPRSARHPEPFRAVPLRCKR